jgi:Amt family ammonium transporter
MQIETASTLLLPLGIWLILSSGTPSQLHRRLAAAALIALAIASLTFYVVGFGLMFGGAGLTTASQSGDLSSLRATLSLPGPTRPWIFAGMDGFALNNAAHPGGLTLFVSYWPLAAACTLLLAGVLAQSARTPAQVMLVGVTTGFVFPVIGCWLWGNGWLSALGENLNLGEGVVDLGRLSALGLVAGAGAVAWLVRAPHRAHIHEPALPPVQAPTRAVAGVICVLIGTIPPSFGLDPAIALGQFVNSSIVVSVAILTAGAYTLFTTRNTDVLSASRAALAAVFVASSGGALMPAWVLAALGVVCGLLATVGYYVVNERLRWRDDSAIVTSVFAASAIGMLATGLFANGGMGISGLLPGGDNLPDPGQFVAQTAGLIAIALFSYAACLGVLVVAAKLGQPVLQTAMVEQTPMPAPAITTAASLSDVTAALPETNSNALPVAEATQPIKAVETETTETVDVVGSVEEAALPLSVAPAPAPAPAPAKSRGLLAWLRRSSSDPLAPKQPRRVAYPYRASGRRLTARPLAADGEDEARPPLAPSE